MGTHGSIAGRLEVLSSSGRVVKGKRGKLSRIVDRGDRTGEEETLGGRTKTLEKKNGGGVQARKARRHSRSKTAIVDVT